ncbi:MAG: hypothetical protein WCK51_12120 [Armatimonadota bacterium]
MKLTLKLLLTTLVIGSVAAAGLAAGQVTWENVTTFVGSNATYVHPNALADIQAEKNAGMKTWQVFTGSSNGVVCCHGVGWPSTGEVINFETATEATIAGSMIDACPTGVDPGQLAATR